MLYCHNCQLQVETGKFCSECGSPLQQQELKENTMMNTQRSTLEEILGWIQNKLDTYGTIERRSEDGDKIVYDVVKIDNFNGNVIELRKDFDSFSGSTLRWKIETLYRIDLSKLTTEINIDKVDKKEYSLQLNSMPIEKAITRVRFHEEVYRDTQPTKITDETEPIYETCLEIYIDNKKFANRIATAFQAAIQQCGGTSELF